jgi:outer membrane protein W
MKMVGVAAGALASAAAMSAFAESSPAASPEAADVLTAPVRAPDHAFELGVEAGYTQGFGAATSDRRLGAGPGASIGATLGYRITPYWSVGVGGRYQAYSAGGARPSTATLLGATADVHGTYHLSPYHRLDPYINVGAGYRLFAESPAGDAKATLSHRLELGKIEVGLDVRSSESVAISPVVGLDVNLFMLRAGRGMEPGSPGNQSVSTFVFAGVKGRFDVGGARLDKPAP